ncbi:MAG: hypothetical protein OXB95_11595 [Rhodobacteraceae bacterium]|nr:hypothetical protein [Paracoccaceae bacterium]
MHGDDFERMLEKANANILDAVELGDSEAQAAEYRRWGDLLNRRGRIDEGCFFLTQAYVLALECGLEYADDIQQVLISHGRDRE